MRFSSMLGALIGALGMMAGAAIVTSSDPFRTLDLQFLMLALERRQQISVDFHISLKATHLNRRSREL